MRLSGIDPTLYFLNGVYSPLAHVIHMLGCLDGYPTNGGPPSPGRGDDLLGPPGQGGQQRVVAEGEQCKGPNLALGGCFSCWLDRTVLGTFRRGNSVVQ